MLSTEPSAPASQLFAGYHPLDGTYDELVESLGCDGILVRDPSELRPALERAFGSGRPTLVNVLTDPEVVYPRKSNLA